MNSIAPFLYQYLLGGLIFAGGIYFGIRGGFLGLEAGPKRRNLILSFGGLFLLAGIQGYLQFVAPMSPHAPVSVSQPLQTGQFDRGLDYAIMVGYLIAILGLGIWFGRHSSSTKDFFSAGNAAAVHYHVACCHNGRLVLVCSIVRWRTNTGYLRVYPTSMTGSGCLFLFGWLPIIFFTSGLHSRIL